jgi:hypothetical protein
MLTYFGFIVTPCRAIAKQSCVLRGGQTETRIFGANNIGRSATTQKRRDALAAKAAEA